VTPASTTKKSARNPEKSTLGRLGLVEDFRAIDYDFAEATTVEIPARNEEVENLTADDLRAIALAALDRAVAAKEEQQALDVKSWQWSHYETIRRRMSHIGHAAFALLEAMEAKEALAS